MSPTDDNESTFLLPGWYQLDRIQFDDAEAARQRWDRVTGHDDLSQAAEVVGRSLFAALQNAAQPDLSLLNFERFLDAVPNREETLSWLASQPRAIEIMARLFVGSPALAELLIREPDRLRWLTDHHGLTEFPSREDFVSRAKAETEFWSEKDASLQAAESAVQAVLRYQRRELLRIAACDTFHLVDLKTATRQLSLLADAVVQVVLDIHARVVNVPSTCLTVLAFGKLGGLELNYSSDIDLLFIGEQANDAETTIAQRVVRSLVQIGPEGFLYRTDMRLRPWGRSGPLVVTGDRYRQYLSDTAELWEKQALLKARPIAGDLNRGDAVLKAAMPEIFNTPVADVRANVRSMKDKIERSLQRRGSSEGHVKSGEGGIRDVEFVTQFLQLMYGGDSPWVRTQNTTEALLRLFDVGALETDQYRVLSAGYLFHRVVEHALQLQDMGARHALPTSERALNHLARRLDFPSASVFMRHYRGHCSAVRAVYDEIVGDATVVRDTVAIKTRLEEFGDPSYREAFSREDRQRHRLLRADLRDRTVVVSVAPQLQAINDGQFRLEKHVAAPLVEVTIAGRDRPGDLSVIAGLLQVYGFSVESADAFPGDVVGADEYSDDGVGRWFVDRFLVTPVDSRAVSPEIWNELEQELARRIDQLAVDSVETHADIALRVADSVRRIKRLDQVERLAPIEVVIDDQRDADATVLQIRTDDAPGVLFNLTTALALARLDIRRVVVRTEETADGRVASDTFHVLDTDGRKLPKEKILELRAAIVLTTQFTNLLPHSPDPRRALTQFHQFLQNLFTKRGWMADLASLQDSRVLVALTKLLGVSEFLWDDFLRYQHENLFPVVQDQEGLEKAYSREEQSSRLREALSECHDESAWIAALNGFKDREMLRIDMRLILNVQTAFDTFSRELTALAESVVAETACFFAAKYGVPLKSLSVCALGKCGGFEMGFASDVELMFLYDDSDEGVLPTAVEQVAKSTRKAIKAPREGVFSIDFRLRPHGNAGSLAVSLTSFQQYFAENGPAWPFERQALVKLRPLALGEAGVEFADRVKSARAAMIFQNRIPDVASVRAMREMQVRQLVEADTFNVKLSPGGLVDAEYFVQILQLRWGHLTSELRTTNTREALRALEKLGYLSNDERTRLRDAYRFLRRVINGLRMVRGDARDLTLPAASSDERVFLVRRLQPATDPETFDADFRRHTGFVLEMTRSLASRVGAGEAGIQ